MLAYTALMLIVTAIFTRKEHTAEGFHVADRRMGTVSSAMSIAATWIWAPALFTSAERAYGNGIPGLFWFLAPNVACLLLFIPYAKRIRRQIPRGKTLHQILGGKVCRVIVEQEDEAAYIYGTITHNRARGTHLLGPMKAIIKQLLDGGKTVDEIGKHLGMRPEEVFRLSSFSKEDFLRMMAKRNEFSTAEYITKY